MQHPARLEGAFQGGEIRPISQVFRPGVSLSLGIPSMYLCRVLPVWHHFLKFSVRIFPYNEPQKLRAYLCFALRLLQEASLSDACDLPRLVLNSEIVCEDMVLTLVPPILPPRRLAGRHGLLAAETSVAFYLLTSKFVPSSECKHVR